VCLKNDKPTTKTKHNKHRSSCNTGAIQLHYVPYGVESSHARRLWRAVLRPRHCAVWRTVLTHNLHHEFKAVERRSDGAADDASGGTADQNAACKSEGVAV
jgi:hypothetical protein